jgi:hypothetical protein
MLGVDVGVVVGPITGGGGDVILDQQAMWVVLTSTSFYRVDRQHRVIIIIRSFLTLFYLIILG